MTTMLMIVTMLAQSGQQDSETPGGALGIAGGFSALLLFLIWFTRQLHADGKEDRKAAAAERIATATAYKETATLVAAVVERNTEAHIRANVILGRVEDRLEREERESRAGKTT